MDPALTKIVLAHVMIIHLSALFQRELTDTYEVVRCTVYCINTRVDLLTNRSNDRARPITRSRDVGMYAYAYMVKLRAIAPNYVRSLPEYVPVQVEWRSLSAIMPFDYETKRISSLSDLSPGI